MNGIIKEPLNIVIANTANTLIGTDTQTKKFADFLLPSPPNDPKFALQMTRTASCCALFALAVLRSAGVDHPLLRRNYVIGTAVTTLMIIAKETSRHNMPTKDIPVGSVILLRPGLPTEHVLIKVDTYFVDWTRKVVRKTTTIPKCDYWVLTY
jgi:hypothetical protein